MDSSHARDSNSSSDPYALNSESGDLYGIVGLNYRPANSNSHPGNQSAFSLASSSATSMAYPRSRNGQQAMSHNNNGQPTTRQQNTRLDEHNKSTSDGSSSSGFVSYSTGGPGKMSQSSGPKSKNGSSSYAEAGYSTLALDYNRPMKIFNMAEFKLLLERELQRPNPNRQFLQSKCISVISFVVDDQKMLNLPSWIMIINIVAVDLLKTELGLFGPHDLLFGHPMMNNHHPVGPEQPFGRLFNPLSGAGSAPPPPPPLKLSELRSRSELNSEKQLAASKKAFANAAASGAYNGEHYAESSGVVRGATGADLGMERARKRYGPRKAPGTEPEVAKADSDGELQMARRSLANGKPASSNNLVGGLQQSSSSSGFNSHCSSQNDSSAASSSSNIASSSGNNGDSSNKLRSKPESAEHRRKSPIKTMSSSYDIKQQSQDGSDGSAGEVELKASNGVQDGGQEMTAVQAPRGKRPPKLPHRVGAGSNGLAGPITIPAPPTEPSEKANLILVSPTGLSPPLSKRKGARLGTKLANSCGQLYSSSQEPQGTVMVGSEADDIYEAHQQQSAISSRTKLPDSIPAHAQLAPPATQRHILKYLLSATSKLQGGPVAPNMRQPARPARYQRPLPIVPSQRMGGNQFIQANNNNSNNNEQHEDNLYYCGLQARVPNRARQAFQLPPPPHQVPQNAINAMLMMDHHNKMQHKFYRQQQQQQRQFVNPYLRPQFSLTNLQDASQLLHMNSDYMNAHSDHHLVAGTRSSGANNNTNSKPFFKLFKQSSGNNNNNNNNDELFVKNSMNDQIQYKRGIFSSVDNLNQLNSQKSAAPSFLNQMGLALSRNGLKLKSSKSKK